MVEILTESHGNILGIKASGMITDDDYKTVIIPALDRVIEGFGSGKFLYYLSDEFEGFDLSAAWDDFKYGVGHADKFDKIALVGGPTWMAHTSKICGHFMKAEVSTFEEEQLEEAWKWLEA